MTISPRNKKIELFVFSLLFYVLNFRESGIIPYQNLVYSNENRSILAQLSSQLLLVLLDVVIDHNHLIDYMKKNG